MTVFYDREKDILVYERKLQTGPGQHEYGLEVCKALSLPQEFMSLAHSLNPRESDFSRKINRITMRKR